MLNISRIHIRHPGSPCNTRFAYPTYLANACDTRHVRAWMRIRHDVGTFICSYSDWPYRSGVRDTSSILPFATRMRSSLISRESNPVTYSRNQRFASSLFRRHWLSSLEYPLFKGAFVHRSPHRYAIIFPPSAGSSAAWTSLSIHSPNLTRVACVTKNRAPRRGVIRHAVRGPQGTSVSLLDYSSLYVTSCSRIRLI
jgi:hypothetical protein